MVKVVDYTISRGIQIISESGSAYTHVGETLAKWLEVVAGGVFKNLKLLKGTV